MPRTELREHINNLEVKGLLHHVTATVDKDWEVASIMRRVIRQPEESDRYAIMYNSVKSFPNWKIVVGAVGANTRIYGEGLGVASPNEILEAWCRALSHPIKSRFVKTGVVKQNIVLEDKVDLSKIPFPTWTPGKDASPYDSAGHVITRDPETGTLNVGNYRKQIKGKTKTGILISPFQHIGMIYQKYEKLGKSMPVAVAIGNSPCVTMAATAKVPFGVDEFEVAGAMCGEPLELVKCETNDLPVPASAELVIEGEVPPDVREMEGPFGEYTGYMAQPKPTCLMNVHCITGGRGGGGGGGGGGGAPSESMILQGIALEAKIYKHLVYDFGFPVKDVFVAKDAAMATVYISIYNSYAGLVKQVQQVAISAHPAYVKNVVVVDDDVDIRDTIERDLGVAFRMQADRDMEVIQGAPSFPLDPSIAPYDPEKPAKTTGSKLLIDATKKWPYPDISLPPKEYLKRASDNWSSYGLPALKYATGSQ
ncbi:MAG: UbiD family decarboxylase [Nitrososphaerota archaeon]|nr:UbiD family decarboxylase [Nitrososphaerota archaeon]